MSEDETMTVSKSHYDQIVKEREELIYILRKITTTAQYGPTLSHQYVEVTTFIEADELLMKVAAKEG